MNATFEAHHQSSELVLVDVVSEEWHTIMGEDAYYSIHHVGYMTWEVYEHGRVEPKLVSGKIGVTSVDAAFALIRELVEATPVTSTTIAISTIRTQSGKFVAFTFIDGKYHETSGEFDTPNLATHAAFRSLVDAE